MEHDQVPGKLSRKRRIKAITTLSDPARLALFELVSRSAEPLTRDAAAAGLGMSRSTAAFHLDRLADDGLLEVRYRRLTGRTGPGAGRPSKLYGRPDAEISVSVPERHYDLLGELLATAIEESARSGEQVATTLEGIAVREGERLAGGCDSLVSALEANGFEPLDDGGDLVLGNCPFHSLAQRHTDLVCSMNRALISGIDRAVPDAGSVVVTDPQAGRCCVRIRRETGEQT